MNSHLQIFLQTLTNGVAVGALYALIALGYTLVFGILQFINFAHGDVFALGAWFTFAFAMMTAKLAGQPHLQWIAKPLILALAVPTLAVLACGLLGFLIERLAYKPLRQAPRINVLITAIGVSLLLENVGQLDTRFTFGPYPKLVPSLLPDWTLPTVGGVQVQLVDLIVFTVAVTLMIGMQLLIYKTKLGSAMRAVSFNTATAALMGINVDRIISITFIIGSMLAGAAGFLYAMKYPQLLQTASSIWILLGLKAFVAAVVGGIGNVRGAMLGGLLIGLIEFFGGQYISNDFRDVYVFVVLILVLLIRPAGILGTAAVEKV